MSCAVCGLPLAEWTENEGKGVKKDDVLYCSSTCAKKGTVSNLYASPYRLRGTHDGIYFRLLAIANTGSTNGSPPIGD